MGRRGIRSTLGSRLDVYALDRGDGLVSDGPNIRRSLACLIGPNQRWDQALSANNMFVLAIVLAIYWIATFIAFRGVSAFANVSKWAV